MLSTARDFRTPFTKKIPAHPYPSDAVYILGMGKIVEIYTDGSCWPNPGPGGWAALLKYGGAERELSGFEPDTTNNRMELTAAIMALEALKRPCAVELCTDSQYVQLGITEWIDRWKAMGWRSKKNRPILNRDLWHRLDALRRRHDVTWRWVRGHSGHPDNERVDRLASEARNKCGSTISAG